MAYIGKTPVIGNFVKLDAISVVNGQAAYTMQNSGVNFTSYDNVNQFLVSLNGILQSPTDSFTVSGSTLTFASNLSTGDVIDFVMVLGNTLDVGTPSDNTVSLAKLTATGTKDATTFLRGDNTFDTPPLGGITEADQWRINTNLTTSTQYGFFTANWERVDTDGFGKIGTGLTESSGIFTFPSTGVYLIAFDMIAYGNGGARPYFGVRISTTTDNSTYSDASMSYGSSYTNGAYATMSGRFQFNVTNVSTHKFKMGYETDGSNSIIFENNSDRNSSNVTVTRLGDAV